MPKTTPVKITKKKEVVEFEMTAVIPTMQYANVQPVIKGYGTTWKEARDDALKKTQEIWAMVGEGGKQLEVRGTQPVSTIERERLKCYVSGTELLYDDVSHTYVDDEGNAYTSGSTFAHQFAHEFDKAAILPRYATKYGLKEYEVEEYWDSKSLVSTTLGTAIHQMMETYGTHKGIAETLGKDTGIPAYFLPIVEEWFEANPGKRVFEKFVADKETRRCGRIDSIKITGEKRCVLEDFKTNQDIDTVSQYGSKTLKTPYTYLPNSNLGKYTLQLNFYRSILEKAGWTVEGMELHWLNPDGEWKIFKLKEVDIEDKPKNIDLSVIV